MNIWEEIGLLSVLINQVIPIILVPYMTICDSFFGPRLLFFITEMVQKQWQSWLAVLFAEIQTLLGAVINMPTYKDL